MPPPARLVWFRSVDGEKLRLEVVWDPDVGEAFMQLPGAEGTRAVPLDPWLAGELDGFIARYEVQVTEPAGTVLARLLAERREAADAVRRSRADHADPIPEVAAVLGGSLAPFQWAGVRYALDARADVPGRRAGARQDRRGARRARSRRRVSGDRRLPGVDEARLAARGGAAGCPTDPSRSSRGARPCRPAATSRSSTTRSSRPTAIALSSPRPRALVVDESHYCKNPRAKRTQAVRRLAAAVQPDGLRLALTGTPVLNHAEELIAQLRVIGRLEDFGSGSSFSQQFGRALSEERLHWHLRRRCFVRRVKADVLPQLPAKRQVVVPVALTNEAEYRLAERDVIEWLRSQPLDLSELEPKIAATLRAERLAQLGTLQRLAARGKLAAALAWIHDFLESGEPLVVFARHVEVHQAVLGALPRRAAPASAATRSRRAKRRSPPSRSPAARS